MDDFMIEMIRNVDEKHEDGHKRLRADLRELAERVNELEDRAADVAGRVTRIEKQPAPKVDVSSIQFEPRIVAAIVLFAVSVFSANWASNYSIRSDVRDILTRLAQAEKVEESRARLQEERSNTLKDAIESMRRRQELQQYELQGMKETILALKSAK